jgi:hypothetical protein
MRTRYQVTTEALIADESEKQLILDMIPYVVMYISRTGNGMGKGMTHLMAFAQIYSAALAEGRSSFFAMSAREMRE